MSNSNPTQAQVILDHLLSGKPLTALDALEQYGCFRLAARVFELKKMGYSVAERKIQFSNGKTASQYYLI